MSLRKGRDAVSVEGRLAQGEIVGSGQSEVVLPHSEVGSQDRCTEHIACPSWVREPGSFCPKEDSHKSSSSGQVSETCSSVSEVATPADNGILVTSVSVQSFMSCYLITPFFRELVRILYPSIMIQYGIVSPV